MTANTLIARPPWLKKRLVSGETFADTKRILSEGSIHTVCDSSICPNQNECFSRAQATFLLLGDVCTRACAFCSVKKGTPSAMDKDEPRRILDAARKLGIRYLILTSVTRDDLDDGGAEQFADVISTVRRYSNKIKIEALVPDFKGDTAAVKRVAEAGPDVFGHNIETVERLYGTARAGANYRRSLKLLQCAKEANASGLTKSSIMLGLGETEEDVLSALKDLRKVDCDILTIGQYLRPRQDNLPIAKYVTPQEFARYRETALELGFRYVVSGPFVRSSYMAEEAYRNLRGGDYDRS